MRIEMIATGDELLNGQLSDTNSTWLGGRLFSMGEHLSRVTVVDDDLEKIVATLREAASRAEFVVVSGGLGPTLDDLSVEAACEAFGGGPTLDDAQLQRIRDRFIKIGRELTPNNERQALVPSGAEILGNDFGTATAFMVRDESTGCEIYFLPGVPQELKGIAEASVLPRIAARLSAEGVHRCYREIKCMGLPESHMDQAVRPLLEAHPHVHYGTRVHFPETHVRLLAEGSSAAEALQRCESLAAQVRDALGDAVFGGDGDTMPAVVIAALRARGWKVAFAESLTAGLAAAILAEAPGASDVLLGSSVTYAEALKAGWLGVPAAVLEEHGAVSEECARLMAEGVLRQSGADVAVSLTGVAGPSGGGEDLPPGTVFAAITGGDQPTRVVRRTLPFGRSGVRRAAAFLALDLLRRRALFT